MTPSFYTRRFYTEFYNNLVTILFIVERATKDVLGINRWTIVTSFMLSGRLVLRHEKMRGRPLLLVQQYIGVGF